METETAILLFRNALWLALTISSPILIVGIIVGFGVGLLQALTQMQEQTLAIVLKIVAMLLTFAWFLPWMIARFVSFAQILIENIPASLSTF